MTTYRELLRRLQLRAGIDKPRAPFDFRDINEYMDLKKRQYIIVKCPPFNLHQLQMSF